MKDVFKAEIESFAADSNANLAKRIDQIAAWTNRWMAEENDVIRAAFRFLREPGAVRHNWPTFHEMATAMERGKADFRRRTGTPDAQRDDELPARTTPLAGRLVCCFLFAQCNPEMPHNEFEGWVKRFVSNEFTDAEIAQYISDLKGQRRNGLRHTDDEIRAFVAANRAVSA